MTSTSAIAGALPRRKIRVGPVEVTLKQFISSLTAKSGAEQLLTRLRMIREGEVVVTQHDGTEALPVYQAIVAQINRESLASHPNQNVATMAADVLKGCEVEIQCLTEPREPAVSEPAEAPPPSDPEGTKIIPAVTEVFSPDMPLEMLLRLRGTGEVAGPTEVSTGPFKGKARMQLLDRYDRGEVTQDQILFILSHPDPAVVLGTRKFLEKDLPEHLAEQRGVDREAEAAAPPPIEVDADEELKREIDRAERAEAEGRHLRDRVRDLEARLAAGGPDQPTTISAVLLAMKSAFDEAQRQLPANAESERYVLESDLREAKETLERRVGDKKATESELLDARKELTSLEQDLDKRINIMKSLAHQCIADAEKEIARRKEAAQKPAEPADLQIFEDVFETTIAAPLLQAAQTEAERIRASIDTDPDLNRRREAISKQITFIGKLEEDFATATQEVKSAAEAADAVVKKINQLAGQLEGIESGLAPLGTIAALEELGDLCKEMVRFQQKITGWASDLRTAAGKKDEIGA